MKVSTNSARVQEEDIGEVKRNPALGQVFLLVRRLSSSILPPFRLNPSVLYPQTMSSCSLYPGG